MDEREPRPPVALAHLPGLDAMRGVGALAVLTTHVAFWAGAYTGLGVWGVVLARLDVGVAIFFVLSGFLLARPWLAAAARGAPRPSTGRYLWHRVLRIVPLYVVTVAVAWTFIHQDPPRGPRDWIGTLLMLDTYVSTGLPAGLTQMWSLAVEVAFYLLLPLVMLLAVGRERGRGLRPGRCCAVLLALVATSVAWHLVVLPAAEDRLPGMPGQWLPGYLSWFAVGVGLALAHVLHSTGCSHPAVTGLLGLGRQPGVCWALAGGLLLVASTPVAGPALLVLPTAGETLIKHLLYAAVGGLVVLSALAPDPSGRFHSALAHPLARRLGVVSFGVFCLHLPVLHGVMWVTGWQLFGGRLLSIWLLTVVVSVVAAELTYRVVERPAMRLRGWDPRRRDGRSAARTTTTSTGTSAR